jgi:hypothetical protein
MCSTVGSRVVPLRVGVTAGHHSEDQAGRNIPKRNPADDCEHRQADTPVNSSTEDESCHTGNCQSGEGFVPDVFDHIPMPRRAVG